MTVLTVALIISCLFGCASTPFEGWTKQDTARELIFVGINAVDWVQTKEILNTPGLKERNVLITKENINFYFPVSFVAHFLVSGMLSERNRMAWQYLTIGASVACVVNNHTLGVGP